MLTKAKLTKLKTRGQWIAEAQAAFNGFIRARDYGKLCISSGKPMDWTGNQVDAGHYRSRGSAPHLRFDEHNCHAQSKHDNRYLSGNVTGYRIGLFVRIGAEALDALEADQTPRKYSIDDLKVIKAAYTLKTKKLKAAQA
ncbi:recombination protein NinG [Rhodoferax sp.]|uniref:recombination protein NinG n=1 Tax=Rhodoferax sp. TaxID=50421 RepID=UPI0025F0E464|nr:recombination protein NinG [Rhodoferax sp.]